MCAAAIHDWATWQAACNTRAAGLLYDVSGAGLSSGERRTVIPALLKLQRAGGTMVQNDFEKLLPPGAPKVLSSTVLLGIYMTYRLACGMEAQGA